MGTRGNGFTANPAIVNGSITWPKSPAFSGSYQVQTSPDLNTWTDVTSNTAQVPQTVDSVIWTRPNASENRFVRLSVQPN